MPVLRCRYPKNPKSEKRMSMAQPSGASSAKGKYRLSMPAMAMALAMATTQGLAHPGGLAEDGCHNQVKTGDCHCHIPPGDRDGCPKIQWRGPSAEAPDASPKAEDGKIDRIRIASWNLNLLHWKSDVSLWRGSVRRNDADYEILKGYVRKIDADIIAFQEVNGPQAAARIFPSEEYDIHLSGRYDSNYNDIYTGFAVRRGRFANIRKRDVPDFEPNPNKERSLRWGVDLSVDIDSAENPSASEKTKTLRLLNIHLKSGCQYGSLENPKRKQCKRLVKQIAPLEAWIDDRRREGAAFVVLGDFNRTFDHHGERDHLWQAIDDGDPSGLELHRLPNGHPHECWKGTGNHFKNGVDFFVFGARAWEWARPDSFREILWEAKDMDEKRRLPSDHCPITVDLFGSLESTNAGR
ncbi:endonuclease/exonuclease/phosphatase family protein [Thioalkalivibrio sp. HK1]|uniref:endonuclease/exonuclease/phosphatase family protein n=1 Tax=Thioalkalivibrio sp. HK1 TaxID=1469245 RepID=UPI0004B9C739|nr:endonuclease/exonuclease/phosphatase family protein [Thioalkalivibrio sp. HK1]